MGAQTNSQKARTGPPRYRSPLLGILFVVLAAAGVVFGLEFLNGEMGPAEAALRDEDLSEFLSAVIGEDSPESPPGARYPHIVYDDGVLYVRGIASSEERVAATVAQLEPLFGEGNVIAEVLVDSDWVEDPNSATSVYFAENVLFESGSAVVAPEFLDVLGASVAFLQLSPETTISISGHTDSNGDLDSNLVLSQARVDAARVAMIEQGGDADRITAIGWGETLPIADNSTAEGRQLNRRVELTIEDGAG